MHSPMINRAGSTESDGKPTLAGSGIALPRVTPIRSLRTVPIGRLEEPQLRPAHASHISPFFRVPMTGGDGCTCARRHRPSLLANRTAVGLEGIPAARFDRTSPEDFRVSTFPLNLWEMTDAY